MKKKAKAKTYKKSNRVLVQGQDLFLKNTTEFPDDYSRPIKRAVIPFAPLIMPAPQPRLRVTRRLSSGWRQRWRRIDGDFAEINGRLVSLDALCPPLPADRGCVAKIEMGCDLGGDGGGDGGGGGGGARRGSEPRGRDGPADRSE